ncbi:MAG: hypothetical protein U0T81_01240 [Saprospiraceae bacterium]
MNADVSSKRSTGGDSLAIEKPKFTTRPRVDYKRDSLGNILDSTITGTDTIPLEVDPMAEKTLMSIFTMNGATARRIEFSACSNGFCR